jgi:replicative superfamily II helicase
MSPSNQNQKGGAAVTAAQVIEIVGTLTDARVMAIIATGATIEQIEEAAAWADGESDVMGDLRLRAAPPVIAVYEILRDEQKYAEDRD